MGRIDEGSNLVKRQTSRLQTDVVVVGSGPGGATVARELAKRGRNVIILERGKHHKWRGNALATLFIIYRQSLFFP